MNYDEFPNKQKTGPVVQMLGSISAAPTGPASRTAAGNRAYSKAY